MSKTVIEMAREAGWKDLRDHDSEMQHDFFMGNTDSITRLVELARADERAKLAEQPAPVQPEPVAWMQDSIELYVQDRPSASYTIPLYTTPQAQPAREPLMWRPMETAPSDMRSCLFLVNGFCVQGFIDATGAMMVQSEITPHWRKMRGKPTNWMPLPPAHGITKGNT